MEADWVNVYDYLDNVGVRCVSLTKRILNKERKKATGQLINSLDYDIVEAGGYIKLVFEYADHGKFVLDGRKPNQAKGSMPPISKIEQWLLKKKISAGASKVKPVGGYKIKGKKGAKELKKLAWAVAKSIQKKGIKPFNFLEMANKYIASDNFRRGYEAAFKKDFEIQLQKKLNQIK